MNRTVRFVGGEAAGDEMLWDRDRQGPVIRIPSMPEFPVGALPGDADLAEPYRFQDYRIHEIHYGSGHSHVFACPDGWNTVSIFNEMWHEYRKAVQK